MTRSAEPVKGSVPLCSTCRYCVFATPCSLMRYSARSRRWVRLRIYADIGEDENARKKSFRSALKLLMSPSAVMNEKTSQFELGPCFSVQVCPPSWRFCATVLPMPPMLQDDSKYLMAGRRGKDIPATVRQPYHARGGICKVGVRCKVSVCLRLTSHRKTQKTPRHRIAERRSRYHS